MWRTLILFAMTSALLSSPAHAQDSHYWTFQYGTRSALLGGAVIASVDDVSATFYNPGRLALSDDLSFAVSTKVFELETTSLEDGAGSGIDLGESRSGLAPSLLAGTIRFKFLGKHVLAYSLLNRQRERRQRKTRWGRV